MWPGGTSLKVMAQGVEVGMAVGVAVGGMGVLVIVGGTCVLVAVGGTLVDVGVSVLTAVGVTVAAGWQLLRRTDTLSSPGFVTARSRLPSSLKSPASMWLERKPAWNTTGGANPPSPLPISTGTAGGSLLAAARSRWPSRVKSLATMEEDKPPVGY